MGDVSDEEYLQKFRKSYFDSIETWDKTQES